MLRSFIGRGIMLPNAASPRAPCDTIGPPPDGRPTSAKTWRIRLAAFVCAPLLHLQKFA